MGQRRKARELAIQFLYQIETTGDDLESALENFKAAFGLPQKPAEFFARLVTGIQTHRDELDELIQRYSHNWQISRMSRVDRNILRLAAFEMLYLDDIPGKVSINEAVELGKAFGTDDSPAFLNGVLDALRIGLDQERAG